MLDWHTGAKPVTLGKAIMVTWAVLSNTYVVPFSYQVSRRLSRAAASLLSPCAWQTCLQEAGVPQAVPTQTSLF